MTRHRTSRSGGAGDPDAGPDPLFGPGLRQADLGRLPGAASAHIGFGTMVRALPSLAAEVARLAWRADRTGLVVTVAAQLLVGVATAVGLLGVNAVLATLLAPGPLPDRLTAATPALLRVGCALAVGQLMTAVAAAAAGRLGPRVERSATAQLLERTSRTEFAAIEDTAFRDMLASAQRGAQSAGTAVDGTMTVLRGLIGLAAAGGALAVLHPVLAPLLLIGMVPRGWAAVQVGRSRYASMKRWIELTRQRGLLEELLTERDPAEEVRVHGCGPFLLDQHARLSRRHEAEQGRLAREAARVGLLAATLAGAANLGTFAALGALVSAGAVDLAAAGTVVVAVRTASGHLTQLVTALGRVYEDGLYLLDWRRACARAAALAIPTGGEPVSLRPVSIRAERVSFAYPGAPAPSVDGVDLEIRCGEIVALVGANGSGKTTLARLLAGLYLPGAGRVSWDGRDTGTLDRHQLFDRVGLVSQDYVRWPFTARVNVAIGRAGDPVDPARLERAARTAGLDFVRGLPHGWDTVLAREFWGGTWLSGGQWQRVGLARCLYRDAALLILDEPTAALDPLTELEVFDHVADLAAAGTSVLLVTHRLGSVRRADRIYLLAGGRVVEQGRHGELLAAGGAYSRMYRRQAEQFAGTG